MITNLDGDIELVGETYQNSAGVSIFGSGDDEWVQEPGVSATFALNIQNANLKVNAGDLLATTTIDFNLEKDASLLNAGSATLDNSGNFSGRGWYVESFFDVFYELSTDTMTM